MFKNIKELLNLKKSLQEKRVALNQLENRILAKDHIWQEIVDQATKEANEQAAALIAESQNKLTHIEQEIANKDTYLSEVEEIKAEYDKIAKQVESQRNKLSRIKSLYKGMEHAIDKFFKADAYIHELKLPIDEVESAEDYAPTVTLKLHCMDLKELKKAFNENNKNTPLSKVCFLLFLKIILLIQQFSQKLLAHLLLAPQELFDLILCFQLLDQR